MSRTTAPVAIVTGARGGIGAAICDRLTRDGFRVAGFDMSAPVEGASAEWNLVVDVTSEDAVREAIATIVKHGDALRVVVNCAGTAHRGSFEETSAEEFMTDLRTNLLGTFLVSQAAVFPHMVAGGGGRIINIASISGKRGGIGDTHPDGSGGRSGPGYASAKAGVINLTRWMAREVGRLSVTCNVVAPGPIRSPMTMGHAYDTSKIPLGRIGDPEEVAAVVSFLASSDSDYVSGTVVDVDGAMSRA